MDPNDPVDHAAMIMFEQTSAYITALERGGSPDPVPMIEATVIHRTALRKALTEEAGTHE